MKKTKLMGAAVSAVVVGLLAVGCDSTVLNDVLDNSDPVKASVSDEAITEDIFDPGSGVSFWYGEALNNENNEKTSAIMKIEPLPVGTSTVIDGYIEFAIIKDTGNISKNTGWLGSYKMIGETSNTKKMDLRWGGDTASEGMKMFDLLIKPDVKEAFLKGSGSGTANYTMTLKPAAIGDKEVLSVEELTKGFQKSTGADEKNYLLSLQTDGSYVFGGKVNGFQIPDGKWEITEKGDIILTANYQNKDVVINRVAGVNIGDGTENWGRGSVAAEKCLWIAFDSADLQKVGYTGKAFSNLPILFSLNTNTVTQ